MKKKPVLTALPVLFGFFVMGFCDIVGISSDYAASAFGWSPTMAGLIPSVALVIALEIAYLTYCAFFVKTA